MLCICCCTLHMRFHPTMVLAQPSVYVQYARKANVSIPLWFSLNTGHKQDGRRRGLRFHPTMVLTQLGLYQLFESFCLFPSHYGSHSTQFMSKTTVLHKFPSHYGSRSTRRCIRSSEVRKLFPSHYGSRSTLVPSTRHSGQRSFHPTMVLAQLL